MADFSVVGHSFSRRILWLKLPPTNSDPKVISRYFVEQVELVGGKQITTVTSSHCFCFYVAQVVQELYTATMVPVKIDFRYFHEDSHVKERFFIWTLESKYCNSRLVLANIAF